MVLLLCRDSILSRRITMKVHLAVLYMLQLSATMAQVQFTSKYHGQTVTGLVNSSFNFSWIFTNNFRKIEWGVWDETSSPKRLSIHLGLIYLPAGPPSYPVSPDSPYYGRVAGSIKSNSSSSQVIFTLGDIRQSDEVVYGCVLYPKNLDKLHTFDTVNFVVKEKPTITVPTEHSASYNEGSPVDLTCTATGIPEPDVRWIHDGYIRTSGRKTTLLTFSRINKADVGNYTCIANNSAGSSVKQVNMIINYAATITSAILSPSQSWVGQTIELKCVADGVPTPTLTWRNPDGTKIKEVIALENTERRIMKSDKDFRNYTCSATNGLGGAATTIVQVQQIKAPGSPNISVNIQATSITVNWTKPADSGGSPITAYRVLLLKGKTEVFNENITNRLKQPTFIGGLTKSTTYTLSVFARNYVFEGNATETTIQTKSEGVPAAAEIIDLPPETNETEITLEWKEAENNGAPITQYTVYQRIVRKDGTSLEWIKIREVKPPSDRKVFVKLKKGNCYEFVVTATNKFDEGGKEMEKIKKIKVLGDVPSPVDFTCEVKDDEIIFEWKEPENNGAAIAFYTVYYGSVNKKITDVSKRTYVVKVEKGKKYTVVVTASNKHGESSKKGKIKQVNVSGAISGSEPSTEPKTSGLNEAVVAGAAAGGVLVIVAVIVFAIWWKRRKISLNDTSSSGSALRNDNAYEGDDGYQDVHASAAAEGLQASGRPVAEPNYAQVDMSKKKRNRRPVTDEYAVVDKSKKSKKPRKRPGELDYAELDDLRPNIQPAAAEAAPARPLVRRPAYERTEYADIAQFGVTQPEPTYGNVPNKDVVYSNVQGI